VADEVRKLAEKTMGATKEVEEVIGRIRVSAANSVAEMGKTSEQVEVTASLAKQAGGNLADIITQSEKMADMVRSIATAAEQQSATSEEINTSAGAINEHSRETLKQLEEAADELHKVAQQSARLKELVAEFDVSGSEPTQAELPAGAPRPKALT
jgi:methyl-accepting chemotaxis protein